MSELAESYKKIAASQLKIEQALETLNSTFTCTPAP
jgi:hypothetical protein